MNPLHTLNQRLGVAIDDIFLPEGLNPAQIFEKAHPVVLINLRPHQCLNVVHYSLFQRIAVLHELDYRVTVVFYDKTLVLGGLSTSITDAASAAKAMDWQYEAFQKYPGIKTDRIEFIPESVLWSTPVIKCGFAETFLAIAHETSRLLGKTYKVMLKNRNLSYFFDVLMGIVYETILCPQFVFFAGREAAEWVHVRSRATLSKYLRSNKHPPAIIRLPDLVHWAGGKVVGTDEHDELFCWNVEQFRANRAKVSEKYISQVTEIGNLTDRNANFDDIITTFRLRYEGHV